MTATHMLSYSYKAKVYEIERIVNVVEGELIAVKNSREDAVEFIKNLSQKEAVTILDGDRGMIFELNKGKVVDYSYEYEMDYKAYAEWSGEVLEAEDEIHCSSCGDGGCVHCEPHRFIEGYRY